MRFHRDVARIVERGEAERWATERIECDIREQSIKFVEEHAHPFRSILFRLFTGTRLGLRRQDLKADEEDVGAVDLRLPIRLLAILFP